MTPDTLGEVNPLSCFDHVGRRLGGQCATFEARRKSIRGKGHTPGASGYQDDSEGGHEQAARLQTKRILHGFPLPCVVNSMLAVNVP
jgi:hypothetical protein